jgi:hypothetical protein
MSAKKLAEVLGHPKLDYPVPFVIHSPLFGQSEWSYRCAHNFLDAFYGEWYHESV